jgi:hypothetical protein
VEAIASIVVETAVLNNKETSPTLVHSFSLAILLWVIGRAMKQFSTKAAKQVLPDSTHENLVSI